MAFTSSWHCAKIISLLIYLFSGGRLGGRCQDGLSFVFLMRPIPAKKKSAPSMPKMIIDFTLRVPPLLFIKLTADIMRPATPAKERMMPSIRFSMEVF